MRISILIVTVLLLKTFCYGDTISWEEWYSNASGYLRQVGKIIDPKQEALALLERLQALDRKDYQQFNKLLNDSIIRYSDILRRMGELKAPEEFSDYHKKTIECYTYKKKAQEALLRKDSEDTYFHYEDMAAKFKKQSKQELLRIYEKHNAPKGFIDLKKRFFQEK